MFENRSNFAPVRDQKIAASRIAQDWHAIIDPKTVAVRFYSRSGARRRRQAIKRSPVCRECLAVDIKTQGRRRRWNHGVAGLTGGKSPDSSKSVGGPSGSPHHATTRPNAMTAQQYHKPE